MPPQQVLHGGAGVSSTRDAPTPAAARGRSEAAAGLDCTQLLDASMPELHDGRSCHHDAPALPQGGSMQQVQHRELQHQPNLAALRPMMRQQDSQLLRLLASLARPATSGCRNPSKDTMPMLQEINRLRGVTARSPRYRALHHRHLQVGLVEKVSTVKHEHKTTIIFFLTFFQKQVVRPAW